MSKLKPLLLGAVSALDRVTVAAGETVRWLTLVIPVVCVAYAVARKLLPWGHNGFSELQWYLFGIVYLISAGYTLMRGQHVRVDFFWRRLSPASRWRLELLFLVPLALISTYLAHGYWGFWLTSLMQREGPEDVLIGLERWPLKLALFVGFALLAMQSISETLRRCCFLLGRLEPNDGQDGPDPQVGEQALS